MIRSISRITRQIFKNLHFLFFLNGMLLAIVLYCYQEDQYEDDLFNLLSQDVIEKTRNVSSVAFDDSVVLQSMHFVHDLEKNRIKYFSNSNFESFKANFLSPLTFHLMTANGSCGSFTLILGRLLRELNYPVRFAQMKVNGEYGGHIILEVKTKEGWKVLDPLFDLYFTRPDGKLANFEDVKANWSYYAQQVPADYDLSYRYEGVQYTNWQKIPVIMPLTKKVLNFTIGKENADKVSLRNVVLSKFDFLLKVILCIYIPLTIWTLYLTSKTSRARKIFSEFSVKRFNFARKVA